MPDTISNYNVFIQNTPARSAAINENFLNHRGTLLPINTDTATASNLTHNLGRTDRRWANGYVDKLFLGQTTTSWSLQDATSTVGNLNIQLNSSTVAEFNSDGLTRQSLENDITTEYTISAVSVSYLATGSGFGTTIGVITLTGQSVWEITFGRTTNTTDSGYLKSTIVPTNSYRREMRYFVGGTIATSDIFMDQGVATSGNTTVNYFINTSFKFQTYDYVTSTGNIEVEFYLWHSASTNMFTAYTSTNLCLLARRL